MFRTYKGEIAMAAIQDVARQFFEACEAGKGRDACQAHCKPDASFSSQAEPLVDVKTLQGYADWMQGLMKMMPDGHYDLKCWATDPERHNVIAYATFIATHTGPGGPPPTGKSTRSDYVYCMSFEGDKIRHMTKIWNAGWALKELGWA
jgi:predicted ester cyclase